MDSQGPDLAAGTDPGNLPLDWVDSAVHPFMTHPDDIRPFLRPQWKSRAILPPDRWECPVPGGEYLIGGGGASDLEMSAEDRLRSEILRDGCSAAILVPFGRGLLPDLDLAAAVCAATNDWLAEKWLNGTGLYGSIRVDPRDPGQAISEIERWDGDDRMVQVVVALESHHPYGQRQFEPVWEACAAKKLPLAVMADGGGGIELQPTAAGYCRYFIEYAVLSPLSSYHHLLSFIVEGVFERIPGLRVVFVDGGSDVVWPIAWRTDKDWRGIRFETPWVKRLPTDYLIRQCRFLVSPLEGPLELGWIDDWAEIGNQGTLCLYGSRYPRWNYYSASEAIPRLPARHRTQIMHDNAADLYFSAVGGAVSRAP